MSGLTLKAVHFIHNGYLCASYNCYYKQPLFPHTAFTDCSFSLWGTTWICSYNVFERSVI